MWSQCTSWARLSRRGPTARPTPTAALWRATRHGRPVDDSAATFGAAGRLDLGTPGNAEVGPPEGDPTSTMFVRRRPTLPQPLGCSTIGAERLNFRVRYGTGCFPFRYGRRNSFNLVKPPPRVGGMGLLVGNCLVDANSVCVRWFARVVRGHSRGVRVWFCTVLGQALGLLVPVGWALLLYTSGLSTPCSVGGLTHLRGGKPHLETCFPLRCIQRLSLPNVANQPCSWRNNWHTRGSSIPVLSY